MEFKKPFIPTKNKHSLEEQEYSNSKKLKLSETTDTHEDIEDDERFLGSGLSAEQQEIWDTVDLGEQTPATIDSVTLKRMISKLEKTISKNQQLRIKYPNDPLKFVESEADLDVELKNMTAVSSVPELYPLVISSGILDPILSILSHENNDILISTMNLLNEWTDEDVVAETSAEGIHGIELLVKSLLDKDILLCIIQTLERLNESSSEEKECVFTTLSFAENIISILPNICELIVSKTSFLSWVLERIQKPEFDSVKQYASEILAILVQSSKSNRLLLLSHGGMDTVLSVLSCFKKRDPFDSDEIEMMENLFDTICSCLAEAEAKASFLLNEGLELMLVIIREKKLARIRAFKVINHALLGAYGHDLALRFIEICGLKTLFAAFMKKGIKNFKKQYSSFSEREEEEHILSILYSLFKHADTLESLIRLLNKFLELDKVDRLVELHVRYSKRLSQISYSNISDEDEYFNRLEAGLFTLQMVDLVLLKCIYLEKPADSIINHVEMLLKRENMSLDSVKRIVQEYADNFGDEDSKDNELERISINKLLL